MNYEKKYKDALERAKEKYAMFEGMKQGDILEDVFPELKESEDEGIKNAIHIYLDWLDGRKYYAPKGEYSIRDMIAWLEKRGEPADKVEQKGMNIVEEDMTPFQKKVFCIIDTAIEEEQGLKQVCDELLSLANDEIKQKPAWSEEDEREREHCIDLLNHPDMIRVTPTIKKGCIHWLKSIRHQNKYAYNPYKAVVESIAAMVEKYAPFDSNMQDFYDNVKVKCKDAKEYDSLFHQNRWKPSDEQINALQTAIGIVGELTSTASLLKEIREQLKKLR